MKKLLIVLIMCAGGIVTSCKPSNEKVKVADTAIDTNDSLSLETDTISDYAKLKAETKSFIDENDKKIDQWTAEMKEERDEAKIALSKKIDTLKAKNERLKRDFEQYQEKGKQNWDAFRSRVKRSIDDIKKDINDNQ